MANDIKTSTSVKPGQCVHFLDSANCNDIIQSQLNPSVWMIISFPAACAAALALKQQLYLRNRQIGIGLKPKNL
jgi:hypothetical protein